MNGVSHVYQGYQLLPKVLHAFGVRDLFQSILEGLVKKVGTVTDR